VLWFLAAGLFPAAFFFFLLICLERCTGPETRCKSTNNNTQEVAGLNTASAGRSFGGAYAPANFVPVTAGGRFRG
jgi:hypothetical protein